jgi:hypothetical protein
MTDGLTQYTFAGFWVASSSSSLIDDDKNHVHEQLENQINAPCWGGWQWYQQASHARKHFFP